MKTRTPLSSVTGSKQRPRLLSVLLLLTSLSMTVHLSNASSTTASGVSSTDMPSIEMSSTDIPYTESMTMTEETSVPSTETPPLLVPENVTVIALNTSSVNVTWDYALDDVVDGITVMYNVTLNSTNSLEQKVSSDTWAVFLDLMGGTEYFAEVSACSEDNVCSNSSKGSGYTMPEAPQNFSAEPLSEDELLLTWTLVGQADTFNITVNDDENYGEEGRCWPNQDDILQCNGTLTNLPIAGGLYNLSIVALADVYKSSPLQYTIGITFPPGAESVICTSLTNASLTIQIVGPTQPLDSFNIDSYTLAYQVVTNRSDTAGSMDIPFNENDTSETVPDLYSGYTYFFTAISVSHNVNSTSIVNATCTTALNPPVVSSVTASDASLKQITVTWNPPPVGYYEEFNGYCLVAAGESASNSAFNASRDATQGICANVTPGALYNVTVATALNNSNLASPQSSQPLQAIAVPVSPTSVATRTESESSIGVTIIYPLEQTIRCSTYTILTNPGTPINDVPCNISGTTSYSLTDLPPDTSFSVSVVAVKVYSGDVVIGGESMDKLSAPTTSSSVVWTYASPVVSLKTGGITTDTVTVSWSPPNSHTNVKCYLLKVASNVTCYQYIGLPCSQEDADSCSSPVGNCPPLSTAIPVNCSNNQISYTVLGLNASQSYAFNVSALNPGGPSTYASVLSITAAKSSSDAWIAGVVIGVLVLIAIAAVIAYFVWKQRRNKGSGRSSSERRPTSLNSDTSEISRPRPVHINEFSQHVQSLHRDADYLFSAEFELLAKLSPKHPHTAAELPVNRVKNRFVNILPFDHSRVKLIPVDDDETEGSDYINASFMPGYSSRREFIAAQGPMRCTVDDYWRMIWEQNVHIIVVVTNLQERGREKCVQYWPNDKESVFHGDVQINMISESSLNFYVLRSFEIRVGNKGRKVQQYHYLNMMDFMAPENAEEFLNFLSIVQTAQAVNARNEHPAIVHCSAGVGRTGTYIVIDHLLKLIKKEQMIDIFSIILDMRDHRCNMIQSEAQYIFVHECLQLAIELGLHNPGQTVNNGFIPDDPLIDMGPDAIYMNTMQAQQVTQDADIPVDPVHTTSTFRVSNGAVNNRHSRPNTEDASNKRKSGAVEKSAIKRASTVSLGKDQEVNKRDSVATNVYDDIIDDDNDHGDDIK